MLCLVYILVKTARDKMSMRVWRLHLFHLPHSQPVLVSSRSSWRHASKLVPSERKRECLKCLALLLTTLARECECLHSCVLRLVHISPKSLDEYRRRECKPGIKILCFGKRGFCIILIQLFYPYKRVVQKVPNTSLYLMWCCCTLPLKFVHWSGSTLYVE